MLTAIIILTSIAQIVLALFVYLKGRKNLTNILFALLCTATLCWALTNYITISYLNSPDLIYIVRLILFCVVLQNAFFYLFARTFPAKSWRYSGKELAAYGIFTIFAAVATLSPFVFTSVAIKDGLPGTVAGPAILIFVAHAAFSITVGFRALIKKNRRAAGAKKSQIELLLLASVLNWIIVPITNFAITPIIKTTLFILIGPVYTLIFAAIIAYAIVSQKLFDIRSAVARSVAYLLSLGMIGAGYGALIYIISNLLSKETISDDGYRLIFIIFALLSALLYPSTKQFFDRVTNRLFYRDAYEPQVFLNQLNETLVNNIELGILLRHTTKVIEDNIKCGFCLVGVAETNTRPWRVMGTTDHELTLADNQFIRSELSHIGKKLVLTEDLENRYSKLRKLLEQNNISVIASLITSYKSRDQATAYLILGPKKSGNIYNKQDLRILEIISNELLIAVQNALRFEEIEEFNVTLQSRINEATAKLQKTNEKLKELDETKDEFLSMASHQLRTPLTSVKGYLSMVLEGDAGKLNPMQKELLGQSFASSQRMVYLIADLLNVSRLKTGKFVIDAHPVNLADVVDSEISQLKETARTKKIKLTYEKPDEFPVLMLDETKTRQVIMNLIDNAIYYTPSGGNIVVAVRADRSNVYFTVKDNGLGVPQDEQAHMFTKFYRAKNAQKARPDGTGLGLYMAKKVINAQGGTILFESKEKHGSIFGFSFQKSRLPPIPE